MIIFPKGVWEWLDVTSKALRGIERELTRIADALEERNSKR